ncbi:MAG: UMP kinase [Euryarchaeota archaeon]|nr:UMP kinase [Euryarchaeota archaeon]
MDTVVASIGGSILIPRSGGAGFIKRLAAVLVEASNEVRLFVVTGGGWVSRYYIDLGKEIGAGEDALDDVGIDPTRINGKILIMALGGRAHGSIVLDFDQAVEASKGGRIVVMAGTRPGQTTDAVAAQLSVKVKADRFVNATSVDGVYSDDPAKNPRAKRFPNMTFKELFEMCGGIEHKAGPHVVVDARAVDLLSHAKIKTIVVDGRDLDALRGALVSGECRGTVVEG